MLMARKRLRRRRTIIKTGHFCELLLQMTDSTFQSHLRLSRDQFNQLLCLIQQYVDMQLNVAWGGRPKIPLRRKLLMANQNSFRELADRFCVTRSCAHGIVIEMIGHINRLTPLFLKHWTCVEKQNNAERFHSISGLQNIIGAIDGCHIRISRPRNHGDDYMNRKGYYSILLQGTCDYDGNFRDIYVGPPGRVHDARMLQCSPIFQQATSVFGQQWKLLGDSAYISSDFPFVVAPKRDNGLLTSDDQTSNAC